MIGPPLASPADELARVRTQIGLSRVDLASLLGLAPGDYLTLERSDAPLPAQITARLHELLADPHRTRAALHKAVESEAIYRPRFDSLEGLPRVISALGFAALVIPAFLSLVPLTSLTALVFAGVVVVFLIWMRPDAIFCGACGARIRVWHLFHKKTPRCPRCNALVEWDRA
jgi:transcriptional regulator with XRE-family HTH domain